MVYQIAKTCKPLGTLSNAPLYLLEKKKLYNSNLNSAGFSFTINEGKTCMKSIQHSDGFYNDEKLAKIKIQVLVK